MNMKNMKNMKNMHAVYIRLYWVHGDEARFF